VSIWELYLGSVGPTLFNDAGDYPDGEQQRGVRIKNRDTGDEVIFDGNIFQVLIDDPANAPFVFKWALTSDPNETVGSIFFDPRSGYGIVLQGSTDDVVTPNRGILIGPFMDLLATPNTPPAPTETGAARIFHPSAENSVKAMFSDGTEKTLVLIPSTGDPAVASQVHIAGYWAGDVPTDGTIMNALLPIDLQVSDISVTADDLPTENVTLSIGNHSVVIGSGGVGAPTVSGTADSGSIAVGITGDGHGLGGVSVLISGDWV